MAKSLVCCFFLTHSVHNKRTVYLDMHYVTTLVVVLLLYSYILVLFVNLCIILAFSAVRCWLVGRKGIRPVKT